jgi:hypothetical protein
MLALIRPRNVTIAIAVIVIALLAAEATLNTKASTPAAAAPTASGNRPTSFETDPIVGSDASISTFGLIPERLMDW